MTQKPIAQWRTITPKHSKRQATRTDYAELVAHTGEILHGIEFWPDSERSCEAADKIRSSISYRLEDDGWVILDEDGWPMD